MSWIDELPPEKRLEFERMRLDAILAQREKQNERLERFLNEMEGMNPGESELRTAAAAETAGPRSRFVPREVRARGEELIRQDAGPAEQGSRRRRIEPKVRARGMELLQAGGAPYTTFRQLKREFGSAAPASNNTVTSWLKAQEKSDKGEDRPAQRSVAADSLGKPTSNGTDLRNLETGEPEDPSVPESEGDYFACQRSKVDHILKVSCLEWQARWRFSATDPSRAWEYLAPCRKCEHWVKALKALAKTEGAA